MSNESLQMLTFEVGLNNRPRGFNILIIMNVKIIGRGCHLFDLFAVDNM